MSTQASERDKYTRIWDVPEYALRSPGLRHLKGAMKWMQPEPGSSVTDWGSGSGQAADAMHDMGYVVRMVDIAPNSYKGKFDLPLTVACLWDLPEMPPTDYGFCADVMEHLPPGYVEAALQGIAGRTSKAAYFQIALFDDHTYTQAGPLHLSLFPPQWWADRLNEAFSVVDWQNYRNRHVLAVCHV